MARSAALPALKAESGLSHYLEEIRRFPMLEPQEEYMLARSWREHGDRVCLSIEDSGVGFELEAIDKLFEPFYTTKSHGMGIGLSVSRSIIESHHGRLWVTRNDGPGATFSFSLDCAPGLGNAE